MILTEGLFGLILWNENGVEIMLMNDFFALFCLVDVAYKWFVEKFIPILDMFPWKTTEYMV